MIAFETDAEITKQAPFNGPSARLNLLRTRLPGEFKAGVSTDISLILVSNFKE